jgi:hypothetical protein
MNKNLTAAQRAAKAEDKKTEADKALAEYRAKEEAINRNTERLRALRLARDAETPPPAPNGVPKVKGPVKKAPKVGLADYLKREADSGRKTYVKSGPEDGVSPQASLDVSPAAP